MSRNNKNLPSWLEINAWREILARIFDGIETQFNVTPEWLVNPATNRRLKLDTFYPNLGVAARFEGVRAKQQRRRLSLEEEEQLRTRQDARVEVCREHDIQLIVIDTPAHNPQDVFLRIDTALSRANQILADDNLRAKLKSCRAMASTLARKVTKPADLKLYAELWQDRLYQVPEPSQDVELNSEPIDFVAGMEVEHKKFGPGVVLSVTPENDDTFVTIDFITAGQKTLAASLVGDKLLVK